MIDSDVYLEGELGFTRLVERALASGSNPDRRRMTCEAVDGCLFLDDRRDFVQGPAVPRRKALDEFPSPYLSGLLDPFFEGKLSPMVETHRGCPFRCTFCHEGHPRYGKVNFFSIERIAQAVRKLEGSMQMWLSVQSMDRDVLGNIDREDIGLDSMISIQDELSSRGLPFKTEIILGLPGETYESHIRTISEFIQTGIDTISTYTLMLLNGTLLNIPEQRERWGLQTRFRVLPRDFGMLGNGRRVIEAQTFFRCSSRCWSRSSGLHPTCGVSSRSSSVRPARSSGNSRRSLARSTETGRTTNVSSLGS